MEFGLESAAMGIHVETISLPDAGRACRAVSSTPSLRQEGEWPTLRQMEERHIREVLAHCSGKLTGTDSATSLPDTIHSSLP